MCKRRRGDEAGCKPCKRTGRLCEHRGELPTQATAAVRQAQGDSEMEGDEDENEDDDDGDDVEFIGEVPPTRSNTGSPAVVTTTPDFDETVTIDVKLSAPKKRYVRWF